MKKRRRICAGGAHHLQSEKFACPVSAASRSPKSNRGCSRFNAPQGACPACDGLGEKLLNSIEDLVVPNHALSIKKGCGGPLGQVKPAVSPYYMQVLGSLATRIRLFSLETPWQDLVPAKFRSSCSMAPAGKPVTFTLC